MKILGLFVPGLWHVFQDRVGQGLLLFGVFAFGLNGYLVWPLAVGGGAGVRLALLTAAVAAWLFSTVSMYRRRPAPASGKIGGDGGGSSA
jgi:hypothetical protein